MADTADSHDWVIGCAIKVQTKHTKEVRCCTQLLVILVMNVAIRSTQAARTKVKLSVEQQHKDIPQH